MIYIFCHMFIQMVISFLNSLLGGEWVGGRDQRQNVQLRNSELEGKMKIQKKRWAPSPSPGEEEWCASSLPLLGGGGGREGGGAPRELLPQGAAVPSLQREGGHKAMPRAGRPEPHSP